jgi:multiple sugar transport system substrate-binding protein
MGITRRKFLAVAATATAGTLLTACTGSTTSTNKTSSDKLHSAHGNNTSPVTLTMWANHPEWAVQIQTLIKEFENQNPGITIQLTEKPGPSYPTLVTSALAAGSAPDIFSAPSVTAYKELAAEGKIYDFTGLLHVDKLLPASTSQIYVGKKYYGIPLFGQYTTGIYYVKPTFAKYGLNLPTRGRSSPVSARPC